MSNETQLTEEFPELAGMEQVGGQTYANTLDGFDEIAIEKAFRKPLDELASTLTVRALLFIRLRREGAKDADAYRTSMKVTLGRLRELFRDDSEDDEEEEGGKASDTSSEDGRTS